MTPPPRPPRTPRPQPPLARRVHDAHVRLYRDTWLALRVVWATSDGLRFGLACVVAIAAIVTAVLVGVNHGDHVACLRIQEQTGVPTRYVKAIPAGECYVNPDGRWIPYDRWRYIEGD